MSNSRYPILNYFTAEHLRNISRPFVAQAHQLATELPPGPETSTALRKLLEAKDAAVRAALAGDGNCGRVITINDAKHTTNGPWVSWDDLCEMAGKSSNDTIIIEYEYPGAKTCALRRGDDLAAAPGTIVMVDEVLF